MKVYKIEFVEEVKSTDFREVAWAVNPYCATQEARSLQVVEVRGSSNKR